MLKILAGEFRSRKLLSPKDADATRPYIGRVKESVFNLLRGWWEGARVLDLFAGVGTVGLEAISRGASSAVMVEYNRHIFSVLTQNIDALGCSNRAKAIQADAFGLAWMPRVQRPIDLIFVDPPYDIMLREESYAQILGLIARCRDLMGDSGFVVLRSPKSAKERESVIEGFDGPEEHSYGKQMYVWLYAPEKSVTPASPDSPTIDTVGKSE